MGCARLLERAGTFRHFVEYIIWSVASEGNNNYKRYQHLTCVANQVVVKKRLHWKIGGRLLRWNHSPKH